MRQTSKYNKKDSYAKAVKDLEEFTKDVVNGKIVPFEEKTERARKNLKDAGLIK